MGYIWINVLENEIFNQFKLERKFGYDLDGRLSGIAISFYNQEEELIAHGYKDQNGDYEFDRTYKYYWDTSINPNRELFECTYDDNGKLFELYWNNFHIDDDGQESFVLLNTSENIQELMNLTGMSQELAKYYMSSEIIPNFKGI